MNNKRIIAKIFNGEELIMTIDRNMLYCEFGALDRGNITDVVNWGIYVNRGSITFIDNIGYFNNKNINSVEITSYTCIFYLVDKTKETRIATFKVDDIDFEEETRKVYINLVSVLGSLQTEKTSKSVYPFSPTSANDLVSQINEVSENSNFSIGEDFPSITIGCPYIGVDTVWNAITKICQATMCRVIEDENGNPIITGERPQRTTIVVNPNNIIGVENAEFVRKNNPNIVITQREKFFSEVLDGSKSNFSIEWDIEELKILGTTGITLSKIEEVSVEDEKIFYAEGKIIIKTPYKIFYIGNDNSAYNVRHIFHYDTSAEPYSDTKYAKKSTLLDTPSIENEQNIVANLIRRAVYQGYPTTATLPSGSTNGYRQLFFSDGTFSFPISTFEDTGTIIHSAVKGISEEDKIDSNDLIQNISTNSDGDQLGHHIVYETYKRYHNGIECFELECLFNDYYDENGNKVYSKDDLSTHFKKYDIIVPYVVKKGNRVPLRVNEDGTPKKFRIIGISYSYDGLLKQKLSIQEERYDID